LLRAAKKLRAHACSIPYGVTFGLLHTPGALRNRFKERWNGDESDLRAALETERATNQAATREADFDTAMAWAGEAVDMMKSVKRAAVPSLPGSAPRPKCGYTSAPSWHDR
jgi:hypothetical protein